LPDGEIQIRAIRPDDKLTGLSLGDPALTPLKTFLQKHAKNYEAHSLARTYGVFLTGGAAQKIVGYMTLVCGEVVVGDEDAALIDDIEFRYRQYPAIKIARLATDKSLQGRGLGRQLIDLAVGIARSVVGERVGCRFVVVDSKKNSVGFYERCGFTILDTEENRSRSEPIMFVDLHKLNGGEISAI
jgi:ribosomal protein S18 acetylase RimI-like enzyme